MQDKIEILPVSLLDQNRSTVNRLHRLAHLLRLEFGWHYLLDLTWIISRLGAVQGRRILDAGAGTGILQWYLADQGAEVISVDRMSRANLPLRFRRQYHVRGLRTSDLAPYAEVLRANLSSGRVKAQAQELADLAALHRSPGRVVIYNQDLKQLSGIEDASLDAIVAVSALEHNQPESLEQVVDELMRVLKPGGVLLATLCASGGEDWFHAPSQGWCYSEASLRRIFKLSPAAPSNYERHDELLQALRSCAELRDHLAGFYARSGDNGMPWGKWDPQYQPVGVLKVKG